MKLSVVRAYLKAVYAKLNVSVFSIDASSYQNIQDSVLVAVVPGSDPSLAPLLLCDHYDTAYEEDTFSKTGERISTPGADDNDSATSTLLLAAKYLQKKRLKRTIWLVHLTGEEVRAKYLVVCCLLFVVYCLLFVVCCCLLFGVCCLLFVDCCFLFVVVVCLISF